MKQCKYTDEMIAQCSQRASTVLCFYHGRIASNEMMRTFEYLSDVEVDSLFSGRIRHDGRRLDQYTKR